MPDWDYNLWDDADNRELMSSVFPQHLKSFDRIQRGVVKADIMRCVYMYAYGGFYLDTDYKVIRNFGLFTELSCVLPVSRGIQASDPQFRIGNAVFGSEPGHDFWSGFIDHILARDLSAISEREVEMTTGPEAITAFYFNNVDRLGSKTLVERRVFHPPLACRGLVALTCSETVGIHLCWGSWRTTSKLKNAWAYFVKKTTAF